jgi:hypothetical protein
MLCETILFRAWKMFKFWALRMLEKMGWSQLLLMLEQ